MKKKFSILMTRVQFEQARFRLVTQHFITADADADHGHLRAAGVSLDYTFDGQALNMTIEHKPLLYSEGFVEKKIRDWFAQA